MTTSWYTPTIDHNFTPPVATLTPNATYSSLLAERTIYCWLTEDDFNNEEFSPFDFDDDCRSLYEDYCQPALTDPIPTSTSIPGSCTPTYESATSTPDQTSTTTTQTMVPTPTPTQANMVKGCTKFHQVRSGDECGTIATKYDISVNDFYDWNPDVSDDCKALWSKYYVCVKGPSPSSMTATAKPTATTKTTASTTSGVATPTPTQADMAKNCNKFHKVGSGDKCGTIAHKNKISLDDFYSWNPDIGDDCGALWLGYYVCVGTK